MDERSTQAYDRGAAARANLGLAAAVVDASDKSDEEIEIAVTKNVPPYAVAEHPARIIQHMVSLHA
ncbi:hypothetical protein [Mesorhizobium sp. M0019]|uniref:hypothetical protein n=1 Tax=Mesorhizobium sp. M0019 TaxID=2956845 RepID=UPI003339156C